MILFDIYTDHSYLTSLYRVGASNARVQRWAEFLTAYNCRIIHRKGAAHDTARTLSIRLSCWLTEFRQHICVTMSSTFLMDFSVVVCRYEFHPSLYSGITSPDAK